MPAPADVKIFDVKNTKLFINNTFVDAASNRTFETINPATGKAICAISEGDKNDIDTAVAAARKAFSDGSKWSRMSGSRRGKLLWKISELITKNADELAYLETVDCGKPISETKNIEIPVTADIFAYYAGAATKIEGETIPVNGNYFNYTLREPLGVLGLIIPWNFPLITAARKIAAALAAGNTVVVKPSEFTPLTTLKLAELFAEAGFPEGVFNVVTGFGKTAGAALVAHADVDGIAFTGSTTTGQEIMKTASLTMKRLSLELGGKSPNIVFADTDLDTTIKMAAAAIFYNKGEVCTAGSRLLIEESIHDEFIEKLAARAAKMMPGDPLNPETKLGPLTSELQMNKVMSYVQAGKSEGAALLAGGNRIGNDGYFFQPTVFGNVDTSMKIATEEIFGPVLATMKFKDFDDVVEKANRTYYGLAAGIWTRDIKKAHTLAKKIKAGTVWINTYNMYDAAMPYGGYKMSGFTRECGMEAIYEFYTQVKSVWVDLN
ncbi:MAG TPA: aldehyde dehydrogenase family protein [bacterium]|nr:aldehyde dehydrogenase family protein [bacterium]HMW32482.1 aldehyde dehydrogenase family protein [bacterium]HMW35521.1 aldehyde dehydrogenase family protein [bacterium]HMZ04881.1 aldehyde dehydrogenase family protein [bacterium]HNB08375.1 aldehyde dehydrogenase family protein [bacterium]